MGYVLYGRAGLIYVTRVHMGYVLYGWAGLIYVVCLNMLGRVKRKVER